MFCPRFKLLVEVDAGVAAMTDADNVEEDDETEEEEEVGEGRDRDVGSELATLVAPDTAAAEVTVVNMSLFTCLCLSISLFSTSLLLTSMFPSDRLMACSG